MAYREFNKQSYTVIFAVIPMNNIRLISKQLSRFFMRLVVLLRQLQRQIILPNFEKKGNLLNTLFLFYIGIIDNIRHIEYRKFKMADLIRNRWMRKGLMLLTFLLYFLTSFEQPANLQVSSGDPIGIKCIYRDPARKSSLHCTDKRVIVQHRISATGNLATYDGNYAGVKSIPFKLYLQYRRLLI